jgi:methionine-rich copper-binding protein CopC
MKLNMTARAAVAALMICSCQFAQAHAYPTQQAPAAGATVATSQKDVVIDFDDGLEPAFSSITVTDSHGDAVTAGKAVVDSSNKKRMSVTLRTLSPGVYTVSWVAVAADGHRTQGHYKFTVK